MLSNIEDDVMVNQSEVSGSCNNSQQATTNDLSIDFLESLCISDTKQLIALKELIFNAPNSNQAKIQFIKEEIAAGRYQTDSNLITAKLMEYNHTMQPEIA